MAVSRLALKQNELLKRELRGASLARLLEPGRGLGPVLFSLIGEDGQTMRSLARATHLAPSTLTGVVRRLGDKGLVQIRPDPQDGRARRVWLSERARELGPQLALIARRVDEQLFAGMTDEELSRLRSLLGSALGETR